MNEQNEQLIRDALAERMQDHFSDGFADRAAARWRTDRSTEASMTRQFRRVATIAAAAVVVLAIYNIRHRRVDEGQSVTGALLGITPRVASIVTIEQIYGLGALGGGG